MAHNHQNPPPSQFAAGEVFEMPADSVAAPKTEPLPQANPWPFYLDQDVRTEARAEEGGGVGNAKAKAAEQPLANPWAYFGPMTPEEEETDAVAAKGVGLGMKMEELKVEGQEEDASLRPLPLHLGGHDNNKPGGGDAPPIPTVSPPPPPPTGTDYIAPLRLSRKQVPAFTVAPAFKPYLPPEESNDATIGPPKVKHQRASSEGPEGALPYRPYRPPGYTTPPGSKADDVSDGMPVPRPVSTSAMNAHESVVTGAAAALGALALKTPSPSTSPNFIQQQQQQQVVEPSGSMESPLDGAAAPHHLSSPPVAGSQPAAPVQAPAPAPPAQAPPVPPPPASTVPAVAVVTADPPAATASTSYHVPPSQTTASPQHHSPSSSASSPALGPPPSSSPGLGYSLNSSPLLGHQAYMSSHSAPTSALPSPNMATYPFQPIGHSQPQNMYPSSSPPLPTSSPSQPASMYYPPAQQYTPPPPTSSYDIPQRTYAPLPNVPPPQPPRPSQYQPPSPGAYQPPSPYGFPDTQRPGTQPPYAQPFMYNLPYGPAVAPHQHQYPTQPTYAAPNSESPSSPNPQDPYAAPPLPPRPATAASWGTQSQVLTGFTPHVVAYPPPPKRVFDPPPASPAGRPRKSSGGMSIGSGKLFSSSSALKWIDKTGKGLENRLDSVLGSQGASKPPPQPPRPT